MDRLHTCHVGNNNALDLYGGGLYCDQAVKLNINFSTFKDNTCGGTGNAIYTAGNSGNPNYVHVKNSIVWGDNTVQDIHASYTSDIGLSNSCNHVYWPPNPKPNFTSNPLYADGDGRLSANSPYKDIDNGDNLIPLDLDGNPRPDITTYIEDIGAFEKP